MRVFNFGSLNVDHVYRVPSIVAAGETVSSTGYAVNPGGKGFNQTVAVAKSGAPVAHAGQVGAGGTILTDYLASLDVDMSHLRTSRGPSGQAIIQVDDNGENAIVLHPGANRAIAAEHIREFCSGLSSSDILMLQNEINGVDALITQASERNATIVLNPAPMDDAAVGYPLDKVDCLVVNEGEGRALCGIDDAADMVRELQSRYGCRWIIVTLGARGACYAAEDGTPAPLPAYRVVPVDTTAAGDAFIGYLVGAFALGMEFAAGLDRAMRAAAITTTRPGAAGSIPTAAEVAAYQFD